MIGELAAEFSIQQLCRVMQLSRSGYYQWRHKSLGQRELANRDLLAKIEVVFEQNHKAYGSPRITHKLREQKVICSENRVARLMKINQIKAKVKRPFRPATTRSRHGQPVAPNHLAHRPKPADVDQVWVADITYLRTTTGWIYLAAVMDLCSRRIVGWSLGTSLETTLVKTALQQALAMRRPAAGLLHHSDRGSQYASNAFRALLQTHQIIPSMSGLGNCYDNANMESFWSTLKTELIADLTLENLTQARSAIFDYIEIFYNRQRLHSALGYHSPVDFEKHLTYNKN